MNCSDLQDRLVADRRVPTSEQQKHLAECPECRTVAQLVHDLDTLGEQLRARDLTPERRAAMLKIAAAHLPQPPTRVPRPVRVHPTVLLLATAACTALLGIVSLQPVPQLPEDDPLLAESADLDTLPTAAQLETEIAALHNHIVQRSPARRPAALPPPPGTLGIGGAGNALRARIDRSLAALERSLSTPPTPVDEPPGTSRKPEPNTPTTHQGETHHGHSIARRTPRALCPARPARRTSLT